MGVDGFSVQMNVRSRAVGADESGNTAMRQRMGDTDCFMDNGQKAVYFLQ